MRKEINSPAMTEDDIMIRIKICEGTGSGSADAAVTYGVLPQRVKEIGVLLPMKWAVGDV